LPCQVLTLLRNEFAYVLLPLVNGFAILHSWLSRLATAGRDQ
jgi:hypothetical protein